MRVGTDDTTAPQAARRIVTAEHWIAEQSDVSTQQAGKLHRCRAGPNRVSNIDIDVESHLCGRKLGPKGDAHAAVCVLVADCDGVGVGGVEPESIILIIGQLRVRDRDDHRLDGADVVGRLQCCEVDICCRSAKVVCGQQDTSLEDEVLAAGRGCQTQEEAFECVQT